MRKSWFALGLVVLFTLFLIIWGLSYFFDQNNDSFRQSSLSGFLATVIGIVVGIPVALWIARYQQREQDQKDKLKEEAQEAKLRQQQKEQDDLINLAKVKEKKERQTKILSLLRTELRHNHAVLEIRAKQLKDEVGYWSVPGVKNDLWLAFSDGGELEWIDDIDLLHSFSTVYFRIRWAIVLETQYIDPHFNDQVVQSSSKGVEHTIRGIKTIESMKQLIPETLRFIDRAVQQIDQFQKNASDQPSV